jgi:hypothetical protein
MQEEEPEQAAAPSSDTQGNSQTEGPANTANAALNISHTDMDNTWQDESNSRYLCVLKLYMFSFCLVLPVHRAITLTGQLTPE